MPHHHPPSHRPPHAPAARPGGPGRGNAARELQFLDVAGLQERLAPLLPNPQDRDFVVRCVVAEGPLHHRGANFVLLSLLAQAVLARGAPLGVAQGAPVPMRLPPHLVGQAEEGAYPVALPLRALTQLAGGDAAQVAAMVDCLTDGPPQHALANVLMVALIEALLPATALPAGA